MAHNLQQRYSPILAAKLRMVAKLKDITVFNNNYEGDPTAGVVQIPYRGEVVVGDYDKAAGGDLNVGETNYITCVIDKDKYVNEIIDGFDAAAVPDNLVADRLDSGAYRLAITMDLDGADALISQGTVTTLDVDLNKDNAYDTIVEYGRIMDELNVPDDNRWLLVSPTTKAAICKSQEFTAASNLGDAVKTTGIIGEIYGFNVIPYNFKDKTISFIAGHPDYATRVKEWKVPVAINNLGGKYIGACAVQGRAVYAHKVLNADVIRVVKKAGAAG